MIKYNFYAILCILRWQSCTSQPFQISKAITITGQYLHGDTLEILSDGKLTWFPFIDTLSPKNIQTRYGGIFQLRSKSNTIRLTFGKSFIELEKRKDVKNIEKLAEHHYSKIPQYRIVNSRIINKEIILSDSIKVGMLKSSFFALFGYKGNVDKIRVVQNFDPPGELVEQTFIFNKDTLVCIIMKIPD